ncbi:MAG: nitroreductase family protein [Spirochaetes bacterium]|nr:MAG: nitroreductase family protein [Spirochaetota bacterium]
MQALEAILSRRSIRKFSSEPVDEGTIEEILKAAMSAPSAGNQQPWHFVVIRDRALLDRVPQIHPHSLMIREVPVAILVCADPTLETHKGYWVQDCAAATENILIAVQSLGLGAVWLGVFPREERVTGLRDLLGIPPHVIPFSLVPIGHPAEQKPPSQRFTREKIHLNGWI